MCAVLLCAMLLGPNLKSTQDPSKQGPLAILEFSDNENFILILQEETPYVVDIFIRPQDKELLATMSGAMGSGYIDQLLIDVLNRFTVKIKQALAGFEISTKHNPLKI
ncbi:MAG: hypothetical protein CM1200mP13_11320 [Candidatus Pelagibacterales bacterium]|nr:MAG: hypothetical protein CM1200mP13_11320 [Pelagibacterales bacterium]